MRLHLICAVAALAATALPCPASAYCRGCAIETPPLNDAALASRAEALPAAPVVEASCHVEKQLRHINGRAHVRRVRICE